MEIKDKVDRYLISSFELCNLQNFKLEDAPYISIGVLPNDSFEILHNGKKHKVVVYDNDHSVPCRSYGINELVKSLKSEYRGLEGKELANLRKSGVEIENFNWVERFIYVGDTTESFFTINPSVFEYKSIIIECTFLEDCDVEQAVTTKHCHWKKLKPIIVSHPSVIFILYHFSCRYSPEYIKNFFSKEGENYLENIHIWTHS